MDTNWKTVIFYHIPKTAGASFLKAAEANFKASELYFIHGSQMTHEQSMAQFKKLPTSKLNKIKFLLGHNTWGLHTYFKGPCTYITFLRDPFDRILSEYHHLIRKNAYLVERKEFKEKEITIEEYFEQGDLYYGHNKYIKMILGKKEKKYLVLESDYLKAIEIIDQQFSCVGITEYFDESILLFNESLNWNISKYAHQNIADNYKKNNFIDVKLRDTYNKLYLYDIKLYEYYLKKFKNKINAINNIEEKKAILKKNVIEYTASSNNKSSILSLLKRLINK